MDCVFSRVDRSIYHGVISVFPQLPGFERSRTRWDTGTEGLSDSLRSQKMRT